MKFYQSGRSMVEMLGVLAIIGVLSVGAIAGYSKAMFKYKLNKQAEQLSTIINNALSYSGEFQDVDAVDMKEVMVKLNAVPKEMIIYEGSTLRFEDAMGNGVGVRFSGTHVSSPFYSVAVKLNSDIINDDRAISSCMNILNTVKAFSGELWQVFSGSYQIRKWGDKYCSKASGNCIRDMTLTEMDEMCRDCNGINCTFEITFL